MSFSFYLFLLLILALSMDAFTAGLSYGMAKVRVPLPSVLTLAALSGCMLTLSMCAGDKLISFIPSGITRGASFIILFLLSLYKFYDAIPPLHKENARLTTDNISQIINSQGPMVLSGREAFLLGLALSVDNISAGLCTGSSSLSIGSLFLITTGIHLLSIHLGLVAGGFLAKKGLNRFTWLGAAILMLLAFLRLF